MKRIPKIIAPCLALLVLFSTFSFTVDKHFCGDFLVDVSVLGKADGCGMEMKQSSQMKSCCSNEQISFEGQDELQIEISKDFSFDEKVFVSTPIYYHEVESIENNSKKLYYKEYPPPDIPIDFQATYQVYII